MVLFLKPWPCFCCPFGTIFDLLGACFVKQIPS